MTPAPSAPDDAAALCADCGFCCDGTFFGNVAIDPAETARLARVGLPVLDRDGAPVVRQPCAALSGTRCTVYPDRPAACGRYACLLRKAVAAGETSLVDARRQVDRMRALVAQIRAALDAPADASIWERIEALEEPTTAEEAAAARARYAPLFTAVSELLELGRASFEPRFPGSGTD